MCVRMEGRNKARARIPVATYRLQFNAQFTFELAASLVDYLDDLGVSDLYSSPVLKARKGSLHGYDVVDHSEINPEAGSLEELSSLAEDLKGRGMGLVMDIVPNHMCVAGSENRWWQDLLENGPSSPFARYFDVDWNPPNEGLKNRVLLPILGDQFGRALENQEIRLSYGEGVFTASYYETRLPIAPRTSARILERALSSLSARLGDSHTDVLELESIINALRHLPPRTETDPGPVRERRREKEVAKRRLSILTKESAEVRRVLDETVALYNGERGRTESFDLLEELLSEQAYRLSFWRVAADEINYRRFFDVNELAAVRVEERPVFTAVHEVVFKLMRRGLVAGLRVDHVDGLFNPEKYLNDLQRECASTLARRDAGATEEAGLETKGAERDEASDAERNESGGAAEADAQAAPKDEMPCYVVAEKILGYDELLRREWPVHGTTGYEFMNLLNGVFVAQESAQAFRALYAEFTGAGESFDDLIYRTKKLILRVAMSSELQVLARRLARISSGHRFSRDFTFNSLQDALSEVIASFPVYRTYIRRAQSSVSPDDRLHINFAIRAAKRRNPSISESIFDFIGGILLLQDPKGVSPVQRAERRDFVMRFQQLTSPVMAKGLEDTAFYRYYPLASLNEVGGEPAIFGASLERFHRRNVSRQETWPHALSATSTHDTKRSEDVRARINVLSEIPEEWNRAIHRWREMNRAKRTRLEGADAPDANEEYLFYQTLVGAWPLQEFNDEEERAHFVSRIEEYMRKAVREAKLHTSWINPSETYERAVTDFVRAALDAAESSRFLADLAEFRKLTTRAGLLNSLSQTLLKIVAPGVPDFYQGTELWQFALVDPDNRRPVDYDLRRRLLSELDAREDDDAAAHLDELADYFTDGRVKLYVTSRALRYRRERRELFERGEYLPVEAGGSRAECVVSFARKRGDAETLALAGRFFTRLINAEDERLSPEASAWGDTFIVLDEKLSGARFKDAFTGREFEPRDGWRGKELVLSDVFAHLPLALLERVS